MHTDCMRRTAQFNQIITYCKTLNQTFEIWNFRLRSTIHCAFFFLAGLYEIFMNFSNTDAVEKFMCFLGIKSTTYQFNILCISQVICPKRLALYSRNTFSFGFFFNEFSGNITWELNTWFWCCEQNALPAELNVAFHIDNLEQTNCWTCHTKQSKTDNFTKWGKKSFMIPKMCHLRRQKLYTAHPS